MKQLIIIFLLTTLFSCRTKELALIIDQADTITTNSDDYYSVLDHTINEDTLVLTIEIKGESKSNRFQLKSNGMFRKSNPPKLHLYLLDNYKVKNREETTKVILSFNISEAKYNDTDGNNTVTLILSGYNKPIKYEY